MVGYRVSERTESEKSVIVGSNGRRRERERERERKGEGERGRDGAIRNAVGRSVARHSVPLVVVRRHGLGYPSSKSNSHVLLL